MTKEQFVQLGAELRLPPSMVEALWYEEEFERESGLKPVSDDTIKMALSLVAIGYHNGTMEQCADALLRMEAMLKARITARNN